MKIQLIIDKIKNRYRKYPKRFDYPSIRIGNLVLMATCITRNFDYMNGFCPIETFSISGRITNDCVYYLADITHTGVVCDIEFSELEERYEKAYIADLSFNDYDYVSDTFTYDMTLQVPQREL